jgi:hypothetical protein
MKMEQATPPLKFNAFQGGLHEENLKLLLDHDDEFCVCRSAGRRSSADTGAGEGDENVL